MELNHAAYLSSLTPEAAAEVLTQTYAMTKVAEGGILASIMDPTHVVGAMPAVGTTPAVPGIRVPHVPSEALRNALIGLGVGGVGGMGAELMQDENKRDYRRVLDKILLGGVMGGAGTMAYRHLANSGDPGKPAAFQAQHDAVMNPPPPEPPPQPFSTTLGAALKDPDVQQVVPEPIRKIVETANNTGPAAAATAAGGVLKDNAGMLGGGVAGYAGGALTGAVARRATQPLTTLSRGATHVGNFGRKAVGMKPIAPKAFRGGAFSMLLQSGLRALGTYGGASYGNQAQGNIEKFLGGE